MAKLSEITATEMLWQEGSAPSTPASTKWKHYYKTDGLYYMDDAGAETGPLVDASAASGLASGTSFPGGPSTNDRYKHETYDLVFYYDGTRWVSEQLFSIELKKEENYTWPITANQTPSHRGSPPLNADVDYWLESWYWQSQVLSTNSGSHYWSTALWKFPFPTGSGLQIGSTMTTAADTADSFYQKELVIDALLGSYGGFYVATSKTGSPGGYRLVAGHITCRIVGT